MSRLCLRFENVCLLCNQLSIDNTSNHIKGLESESRAISKRMSSTSIQSSDEATQSYPQIGSSSRTSSSKTSKRAGTPSSTTSTNAPTDKPSAIPRPSLNYSRPFADYSNHSSTNTPSSKASAKGPDAAGNRKRSRTYSQPYPYEHPGPLVVSESTSSSGATTSSNMNAMANALPTPASSRSNSPALPLTKAQAPEANSKPTRIPKVNASNLRAGSSNNVNGGVHKDKADIRNGQGRDLGYLAPEHGPDGWQVYENGHYASSRSSVSVPHQSRQNGIMNEAPPFSAHSYTSSLVSDAEPVPRPSEEEERPFEHWYRGDLSRNGGVGELRIGNRMEMLEIANYGHRHRQATKVGPAIGRRRRAESIGNRESVVFDDYDPRTGMVLDEAPLTDMEVDTELETDRETRDPSRSREEWPRELDREDDTEHGLEQIPERTYTSASNHSDSTATPTAAQHSPQLPTQRPRLDSQIPRATQKPAYTNRSASEPPESLTASTSSAPPGRIRPSVSATTPQAQSQSLSVAQKRGRAKSPVSPAGNKKLKQAVAQKRSKSAINVRSSAAYPNVPDDADAIPSWTQPKKNGNWDDVSAVCFLAEIALLTASFRLYYPWSLERWD